MKEDIVCGVLHGDTTARLVYGNYRQPEGLNVTYGYNKEHRTDLKQYKIGLVVTEDGFPVIGEILDGNLDDKSWNKKLLANLPAHFNLEELKKIVYVADSSLVTRDNLEMIGEDVRFISRLPDTFNLAAELTRAAFIANSWVELGKLAGGKSSASYKVQEFKRSLHGRTYRFLVVHSDHLEVNVQIGELDEQAYQRAKEHLNCFVLISNIFNGYSNYGLLKEYKQQTVVENRFKFVKHPLYVGPLWAAEERAPGSDELCDPDGPGCLYYFTKKGPPGLGKRRPAP